jgi:hypothetical protein
MKTESICQFFYAKSLTVFVCSVKSPRPPLLAVGRPCERSGYNAPAKRGVLVLLPFFKQPA